MSGGLGSRTTARLVITTRMVYDVDMEELRRTFAGELEADGFTAQDSDAEIIRHVYEQGGTDLACFAFADSDIEDVEVEVVR